MSGTALQPELEPCPGCGKGIGNSWLVCAWCGQPLAAPAELRAGHRLEDRYLVERVLGRGGFGITYAALDTRLQRRVAVKEMFPPSAVRHGSKVLAAPGERVEFGAARDRFLREARLLARFAHPGIVRVYEVFEAANTAYMVMELLDGLTLAELLRRRGSPLSIDEALDVATRVGAALTEVHAAGLLHRDVNPSNLMATSSGRIVLIDFGVARRYGTDATALVTRVVTPGFAPPEQYSGSGSLGPAADVYGLAASLYRLLTGQTPPSPLERQGGVELVAPDRLVTAIPKSVSDAVLDGLELTPSHRPESARAFLDRLGLHGVEPAPRALLHVPALGTATAVKPAGPPSPMPPGLTVPEVGVLPDATFVPAATEAPRASPPVVLGAPQGQHRPDQWVLSPAQAPLPVPPLPPPMSVLPPRVVGPHPRGRRPMTIALTVALASLGSSTPVVVLSILIAVVLPWLATTGDMVIHRSRLAAGAAERRWHHARASSVAPVHVARNLVLSIMRAIPALALGGLVVLVASLADHPSTSLLRDWVIRVGGAAATCAVVVPARNDGRGFRTGTGLDALASRFLDVKGRLNLGGWALVIVCVSLSAAGWLLAPELWPLPR